MKNKIGLAALMIILLVKTCFSADSIVWGEDHRRCMVSKGIPDGRVLISNDEGILEIDVQREGDTKTKGETYTITFDDRQPILITTTNEPGIFDHRLGSYKSVAPIISKARLMKISITGSDRPSNLIVVPIGKGAKAMAFLKKCEDYWRRYHSRRHRVF
jgi:hypothetical protein